MPQIVVASVPQEYEARVKRIADQVKVKYVPMVWNMPQGYPHGQAHWDTEGWKGPWKTKVVKVTRNALGQAGAGNVTIVNIFREGSKGANVWERSAISSISGLLSDVGVDVRNMHIEVFERDYRNFL